MTKNTLPILVVVITIVTMGAGCKTQDTNNQKSGAYNTWSSNSVSVTPTPGNSNRDDEFDVSVVIEPGVEVVTIKTATSTIETQSYLAALSLYEKNGVRLKFVNCLGNPGSLHIKQGTQFMIDNRDNASHRVGIGNKTYLLAAYDFALISIQKTGSFNVTCDGEGEAYVEVKN